MMPNTNQRKSPLVFPAFIVWASALFFLVPNLLFAVQGFSTRYWADDYCFSGIIKEFGFFEGLSVFYSTTSNRFSAFIFAGMSELFGSHAVRVIPALTFIVLGVFFYLITSKLLEKGQVAEQKSKSFLLTQILLFFILYLSPNAAQSLYWRSGLSHYFLPIPILLILLMVTFFQTTDHKNKIFRSVSVFMLACFNAGLSESYAALQFGLFSLFLICMIFHTKFDFRKDEIMKSAVVLVGTAAAMVLMVVAPGNVLRLETLQQAPDIFSIISVAVSSAFDFMKYSLRGLWLPFGVVFGLSILFAFIYIRSTPIRLQPTRTIMLMLLTFLAIFGLIVCVCAPTAYGMMAYPEQRVLMLAHFLLVIGVIVEGVIVGLFVQQLSLRHPFLNTASLIVFTILSLYPLSTIQTHVIELNDYSNRAELWDIRNAEIQTKIGAGETGIVVIAIDSFSEIAELNMDPKFWVNQCAAEYYGVQSIAALEQK